MGAAGNRPQRHFGASAACPGGLQQVFPGHLGIGVEPVAGTWVVPWGARTTKPRCPRPSSGRPPATGRRAARPYRSGGQRRSTSSGCGPSPTRAVGNPAARLGGTYSDAGRPSTSTVDVDADATGEAGGVGTSIIGRPRPCSLHRRADRPNFTTTPSSVMSRSTPWGHACRGSRAAIGAQRRRGCHPPANRDPSAAASAGIGAMLVLKPPKPLIPTRRKIEAHLEEGGIIAD